MARTRTRVEPDVGSDLEPQMQLRAESQPDLEPQMGVDPQMHAEPQPGLMEAPGVPRTSGAEFEIIVRISEIDPYGRPAACLFAEDEASLHLLKSRVPPRDHCRLPYYILRGIEQGQTGAIARLHFVWPSGAAKTAMKRHVDGVMGRRICAIVRPRAYNTQIPGFGRQRGISLVLRGIRLIDEPGR